jgi:hypothetical protein
VRADGGWALRVWQLWQVCREADSMSGQWRFDAELFKLVVPRAILRDDDERVEWVMGMKVCDYALNHREELMAPEEDDDEAAF